MNDDLMCAFIRTGAIKSYCQDWHGEAGCCESCSYGCNTNFIQDDANSYGLDGSSLVLM